MPITSLNSGILIESQWNLNVVTVTSVVIKLSILIESQWNLNVNHVAPSAPLAPDINRITVEFKLTAILFKFN